MKSSEVRGGGFNRRIAIEFQSVAVDSFGSPVPGDWTELRQCWAEILPFVGQISGFSVKPAPETAVAPVTVNVRYHTGKDVTNKMRVRNLATGEIYRILYVGDPEFKQRIIEFACQVST